MQKGNASSWDRHVAQLTGSVVSGGAIIGLPIQSDAPASSMKSAMYAAQATRPEWCTFLMHVLV